MFMNKNLETSNHLCDRTHVIIGNESTIVTASKPFALASGMFITNLKTRNICSLVGVNSYIKVILYLRSLCANFRGQFETNFFLINS